MEVNAVFQDVKVYKVQDRLDVVQGQSFVLEYTDGPPEDLEVFTSNDPVLSLNGMNVEASKMGESKLRFMSGTNVVKDIVIHVVDQTSTNAVDIGLTGEVINQ